MFSDERKPRATVEKSPLSSKKTTIIYGSVVGVCLLAAIIISLSVWVFILRDTGLIPKEYRKGLDFSLYYPYSLPASYTVDPASFSREGGVLIFSIKAPGGRNLAVSQQALPSDKPAHQVSKAPIEIPGETAFTTPLGSVEVSLWGEKYVADIITEDSWIIINATGFTVDEASAVAKSFSKLD